MCKCREASANFGNWLIFRFIQKKVNRDFCIGSLCRKITIFKIMYCTACQNICSDWIFVLVQVVKESQVDEIRLVTGSAESAALRLRVPLQQVQAQLSPFLIVSTWILMAVTLQTLRWASSPGQIIHEIQNHCRFKTSVTPDFDDFHS